MGFVCVCVSEPVLALGSEVSLPSYAALALSNEASLRYKKSIVVVVAVLAAVLRSHFCP